MISVANEWSELRKRLSKEPVRHARRLHVQRSVSFDRALRIAKSQVVHGEKSQPHLELKTRPPRFNKVSHLS